MLRLLLCTTLALYACDTAPTTGTARQGLGFAEGIGYATLATGNNNDWTDATCGVSNTMCRIKGDAGGSVLTGLDQATYGDRGMQLWLWNEGSVPFTIAHNSSSSSLNNRLHLRGGADVVLAPGYGISLFTLVDWTTDPYTPLGWYEIGWHSVDSAVASTPSRSLGTAFRPATDRMTMVTYSASADCTITISGGQEGRVELLSDSANPPTTIRADIARCRNTGTVVVGVSQVVGSSGTASYIVPAGDYVLLRGVNVTSTPTLALTHQTEQRL